LRRAVDHDVDVGDRRAEEVAEAEAVEVRVVEVRLIPQGERVAARVRAVEALVGEPERGFGEEEERELAADEPVEPGPDGGTEGGVVLVDGALGGEGDAAAELDERREAPAGERHVAEEEVGLRDGVALVEARAGVLAVAGVAGREGLRAARPHGEPHGAVEVRVLPVEAEEGDAEPLGELVPELEAGRPSEVVEEPAQLAVWVLAGVGARVELAAVGGGAAAGAEEERSVGPDDLRLRHTGEEQERRTSEQERRG